LVVFDYIFRHIYNIYHSTFLCKVAKSLANIRNSSIIPTINALEKVTFHSSTWSAAGRIRQLAEVDPAEAIRKLANQAKD
jgi:hypothetical protein